MSAELVFMMGEFAAHFPADRQYAKNHMWARAMPDGDGEADVWRFGLSAYAVRLLQDVYFLDLTIEPQMPLKARQEIGSIESKKAESSLYSPLAGRVASLNEAVIQDPSAINVDKYGMGWIFEMQTADAEPLLTPEQYLLHLDDAWKVAQRTIKGQANA